MYMYMYFMTDLRIYSEQELALVRAYAAGIHPFHQPRVFVDEPCFP